MILVSLDKVGISLDGKTIVNDISLTIKTGEKIGLIGNNGCGKTTILQLINGSLSPEYGKVHKKKELKISYLSQRPK